MRDKIEIGNENLVSTQEPRLMHTTLSWRWRTTELWNRLPGDIREVGSLPKFKNLTKNWIISQRTPQLEPG